MVRVTIQNPEDGGKTTIDRDVTAEKAAEIMHLVGSIGSTVGIDPQAAAAAIPDYVSDDELKTQQEVVDALEPLPPRRRKAVANKMRRRLNQHSAVRGPLLEHIKMCQQKIRTAIISQPQHSQIHDFFEAAREGRAIALFDDDTRDTGDISQAQINAAERFLIGPLAHMLIKNKGELEGAEWRLPFPICVFETHLRFPTEKRGEHSIALVEEDEAGDRFWRWFVRAEPSGIWMVGPRALEGTNEMPQESTSQQYVRAACVLMDAEVVTRQVRRVPAKLNARREKRRKPLIYDSHVLTLRQSTRYVGDDTPSGIDRNSPRVHLRRGHWRHLPNYRTWVRWSVVGDPAMGVVDKTYRVGA